MSSINIFKETSFPKEIRVNWIKDIIKAIIHEESYEPGEISVIFCDDDYLLEINRTYLKHDYYTDIITFDYSVGKTISGDLFISIDRVKQNATMLKESVKNELFRVIIHGILHMSGYNDKTDEQRSAMRKRENFYLNKSEFLQKNDNGV